MTNKFRWKPSADHGKIRTPKYPIQKLKKTQLADIRDETTEVEKGYEQSFWDWKG